MIQEFKGLRLSIGPRLSGTRALSGMLLARAGIDTADANIRELGPDEAASQLISGQIDAAIIVTGWEAPRGATPPRGARHFAPAAQAGGRLHRALPFLGKVILPEGAGDTGRRQIHRPTWRCWPTRAA